MLDELKEKFLDLSPRDQLMLVVGTLAVLVYILVFMVLMPLHNELASTQKRNNALLEEQGRVRDLASKVMAAKQAGDSPGNAGQSLNALLNSTLRDHGLRMENFQPSGNSARVRLASAEFNKVVAWLNELEIQRGIQIKDLTITADQAPGSVLVNLHMQRGE